MDGLAHLVGSFVAHVALLGVGSSAIPPLGASDDVLVDEQSYVVSSFFMAAGEPEWMPDPPVAELVSGRDRDVGAMGDPEARTADSRYGVAGLRDNPDPHIARNVGDVSSSTFTVARPDDTKAGADDAPRAAWGRDDSHGTDPIDAHGAAVEGVEIGPAVGAAQLGPARAHSPPSSESTYGYRCRMP